MAAFLWLFAPDTRPEQRATPLHERPLASHEATTTTVTPPPRPPPPPVLSPASPPHMSPSAVPSASRTAAASLMPAPRARLAIIIDDCGQWVTTERAFIALPYPITLSVLPHVRYGPAIAREADAAGKGVMLHLPMETISGRDPGPGTITTAMSDAEIRTALATDLAELPQARGVNNHEGSRATADRRVMGAVAGVLESDGAFFIDSRTSAATVAREVAAAQGVPSASRDIFLDDIDDVGAIESQFRAGVQRARERGSAIAIGHPRAATLAAIRTLAPQLAAEGVDLALASDLVH